MPIETNCPGCGRRLRVDPEDAGKQARCPVCRTIAVIPQEEAATTAGHDQGRWSLRTPEGRVFGPVSQMELDEWVAQGRVTTDCELRREDQSVWQSAAVYYPALGPAPVAAPSIKQLGPRPRRDVDSRVEHATRTPSSPPDPHLPAYASAERGGLVLALGILGWFACPIFGVMAWLMGTSDLREMRAGRMDPRGMGLTQAGQVLGMICSMLAIGMALIVMFLMMVAVVTGG